MRGGTLAAHAQLDGSTALIWAARYGHAECMRILMDAGADMNVQNEVRI